MKLIKSVEVIEVPEGYDNYSIIKDHFEDYPISEFEYKNNINNLNDRLSFSQEVVRGQRYYNYNGEQIVIGMSQDVQDLIGLPFDCVQIYKNDNEKLKEKIFELEKDNYNNNNGNISIKECVIAMYNLCRIICF